MTNESRQIKIAKLLAKATGNVIDKKTNPAIAAQKYINIFRQLHVLGKDALLKFNQELLSLNENTVNALSNLPGGGIVVEYLNEIQEKANNNQNEYDDDNVEHLNIQNLKDALFNAQINAIRQQNSNNITYAAPVSGSSSKEMPAPVFNAPNINLNTEEIVNAIKSLAEFKSSSAALININTEEIVKTITETMSNVQKEISKTQTNFLSQIISSLLKNKKTEVSAKDDEKDDGKLEVLNPEIVPQNNHFMPMTSMPIMPFDSKEFADALSDSLSKAFAHNLPAASDNSKNISSADISELASAFKKELLDAQEKIAKFQSQIISEAINSTGEWTTEVQTKSISRVLTETQTSLIDMIVKSIGNMQEKFLEQQISFITTAFTDSQEKIAKMQSQTLATLFAKNDQSAAQNKTALALEKIASKLDNLKVLNLNAGNNNDDDEYEYEYVDDNSNAAGNEDYEYEEVYENELNNLNLENHTIPQEHSDTQSPLQDLSDYSLIDAAYIKELENGDDLLKGGLPSKIFH